MPSYTIVHKCNGWYKQLINQTVYLGLCLHMWGLQASSEALQVWPALNCRPPLTHRAALVCRAASNLGAG